MCAYGGTTINGRPISSEALQNGDWISIGGVLGRFDLVPAAQAAWMAEERRDRLQSSAEIAAWLRRDSARSDLLRQLLESAVRLTSSDGGCILTFDDAGHVRVKAAIGTIVATDGRFSGSAGAVERAIATRTSVVITDLRSDGFFARRRSVVERGLAALACVPICLESRLVGLLYVDSRRALDGFTELDLEILQALAAESAIALSMMTLGRDVDQLLAALPASEPPHPPLRRSNPRADISIAPHRPAGCSLGPRRQQ
jgi:transcriptional regulator with GAF, ATPase, and Fis domain